MKYIGEFHETNNPLFKTRSCLLSQG